MDNYAAFIVVAFALVASPGPDSMLIIRNAIASGRVAGFCTVAGVQSGLVVHAALSVAGLSALLFYSETLFRLLAAAGALYLAWLGWFTIKNSGVLLGDDAVAPAADNRRAFFQGLFCNLLNPKVIILYIALMPSFVNLAAESREWQLILLSITLLSINTPFQLLLVAAAQRLAKHLRQPHKGRVVQRLLGGVLLLFSLLLFAEHALEAKK